jgi:hypothetical protein
MTALLILYLIIGCIFGMMLKALMDGDSIWEILVSLLLSLIWPAALGFFLTTFIMEKLGINI